MTQKTVGYVKLIWNCPNCSSRNPGPQKICSNCGTPQPDNVKFEQLPQAEIITDQAELAQAQAGADVHCYYCGSRNPATAKACSQCGADLTQAAARESGQVLGATPTGPAQPLICPSCSTPNDPTADKCVKCGASLTQPKPASAPPPAPTPSPKKGIPLVAIIGGAVLLLIIGACILFLVLSVRTTDTTGQVESVSWSRRILVEQLTPVSGQDWRDDLPAGAVVGTCTEKQHGTESHDTGRTHEVCGTPYTVDSGNGFGKVTQDCEDEPIYEDVPVYEDYCSYTATVWQKVDGPSLTGTDLNPRWPTANLTSSNQREAGREENYEVVFKTDDKTYPYTPKDANEFQRFQLGSQWTLNINTFDTIISVEPSQGQ